MLLAVNVRSPSKRKLFFAHHLFRTHANRKSENSTADHLWIVDTSILTFQGYLNYPNKLTL